jgi:histidinol-phosphate phosphatase family protein
MDRVPVSIVVPTIGRPTLDELLDSLAAEDQELVARTIVVDDRPKPLPSLAVPSNVRVFASHGRGPAAARNVGWRAAESEWIVFLDDDVRVTPGWSAALRDELAAAPSDVVGVQGRIVVPLAPDRAPTDRERNVHGLERARWATADMAYRRDALLALSGFDERFRHAYREDADLALRCLDAGWRLRLGSRTVVHSVRSADRWISVRQQAGNADDALMRRLHGRDWRERAGAPRGAFRRHVATVVCAGVAGATLLRGRRRLAGAAASTWLGATARFAWRRIAPGPRTADEVATMAATSALIPFAAVWERLRGEVRWRRARPIAPGARHAVLFDRDGTLVVDVPYNRDPSLVRPVEGATEALAMLRAAGIATAVVTNQSGIARGLVDHDDVDRIHQRMEALLGPLGPVLVCPHGPDDGCDCRKPSALLVERAARLLGVDPRNCVVVGDTGVDVEAARAAGARAILVPTDVTRPDEIEDADEVAPTLLDAVRSILYDSSSETSSTPSMPSEATRVRSSPSSMVSAS